jgi:poly(ADP-ribose) glycohydrolase ARH3
MRIAPIAVRFAASPELLCAQARRSASLTHAHPLAIDAAVLQAAAIGAALRGEEILSATRDAAETPLMRQQLDHAMHLLAAHADSDEAATQLGNSAEAHRSVPTAILAAVSQPRFEQAVSFAISCGGDTDTLGAMAGAIAGGRHGASAIPERWLNALEAGEKGRHHVERLAEALVAATLTT